MSTTNDTPSTKPHASLELDPSILKLNEVETQFFKQQTGISDDEELRKHIVKVQEDAYKVFPYRCIYAFYFTKLQISQHPYYDEFLKVGKSKPGAIYLEFACCFGNDARKAVADGYPVENVIASDLNAGFWDLGHALFRSTPSTFPVPFLPGDVFSPSLIASHAPYYKSDLPPPPHPPLNRVTSLTPLQGHLSFIHVSLFFHLFNEEKQLLAAKALASLLSPEPGSTIFGFHGTQPTPGVYPNFRGGEMYCHTPETWKALWDGEVFVKGSVKVEAELKVVERKELEELKFGVDKFYLLAWSVTRI